MLEDGFDRPKTEEIYNFACDPPCKNDPRITCVDELGAYSTLNEHRAGTRGKAECKTVKAAS
jgi:hypothetical protein